MRRILPAAFVLVFLLGCAEPEGCDYGNPSCEQNHDCIDNECILKEGCLYDNPSCEEDEDCINNACIPMSGCNDGNSPCGQVNHSLEDEYIEQLYDEKGRLTAYAKSFRPEMFSPDLGSLPRAYPEKYGDNHFEPGNYTVKIGDGFGKGDFLIKFVEFIPQNRSIEGQIKFEVFKKEEDGNYYHYPTAADSISRYSYTDIFGILIESPVYSWQIDPEENTLIYHQDCSIFFDYCGDEGSGGHYADGDYRSCSSRCRFDAFGGEAIAQNGIFSAIYPEGYDDVASFSAELLEQCYNENAGFLGYTVEKPRIGMKVYLGKNLWDIRGDDEAIAITANESFLDSLQTDLDGYREQMSNNGCADYLRISHGLTHLMTNEIMENNRGMSEGLAEFVGFHNGGSEKRYICGDYGWRYPYEESLRQYANLSSDIKCGRIPPSQHASGFCFWQDFVQEYGYLKFVDLMQGLQQKGRGTDDYYVMDVMEDAIGGPLSDGLKEKYSLERNSTHVELCHNCEMFLEN